MEALYGSSGPDTLDSQGTDAYEQGNGGGDTFIYDAGPLLAGGNAVLQLFDTGVGSDGAPLALGTADTNWTLVNDAAGTVAYTTNYGSPWLGADGVSDFINPGASGSAQSEPGGIHTYQTTFTIPSEVDPSSLRISGQFAADNSVQAIVLNGHMVTLNETGGFNSWTQFALPSADLVAGTNTLQFVSNNDGDGPTGFRVEFNPSTLGGYGQLEINESGGGDNVLQLNDVDPSQITVTSSNNTVYLNDGVPGEQVQLDDQLGGTGQGVQEVQFSDGTVWTKAEIAAFAIETSTNTGSYAGQALYGTGKADNFDSRGLATYERGYGGGDTFLYNAGYGQLEINENGSGQNVLRLGTGITASNVQVTDDNNGNVYLTNGTSGDRIQLDSETGGTGQGVGQVQFADGSSWSQAQLLTMATTGTSAGQSLYGTGGADTFDSKGLATYERGYGGDDTFLYNSGYGQLEINESGSGTNVLQLGIGITASDVQVTDDNNGNVFLTDGVNGDRIQLDSETGGTGQGVGQVQFADGTSWSQSQLMAMATTGSSAGQSLYGTGGADTFDSKGLATYERGYGGGDTFLYNSGYGQLEINENGSGTNVLQLGTGITASNVQVSDDNNGNVFLTDGVSGDRIQLDSETGGAGQGVGQVQFADGTSWSQSQLMAMATTGSSAGQSLYGTGGADTFDSKGLATYERGYGGGDTFLYNAGYGQLEVNENGSGQNVLQLGKFRG